MDHFPITEEENVRFPPRSRLPIGIDDILIVNSDLITSHDEDITQLNQGMMKTGLNLCSVLVWESLSDQIDTALSTIVPYIRSGETRSSVNSSRINLKSAFLKSDHRENPFRPEKKVRFKLDDKSSGDMGVTFVDRRLHPKYQMEDTPKIAEENDSNAVTIDEDEIDDSVPNDSTNHRTPNQNLDQCLQVNQNIDQMMNNIRDTSRNPIPCISAPLDLSPI